jgi:cyclic pyranopterin phosphate synthase
MPNKKLIDKFGRHIDYLRISVTDRCNFRCFYCMPEEGIQLLPKEDILSFEEIITIVKYAVKAGINKFRITGGEPLVRNGVIGFLGKLKKLPGVKRVALTTNGLLLEKYYKDLKKAGIDGINISLNSLNGSTFCRLTRSKSFNKVRRGIRLLLKGGFKNIKINTVIMRGFNDKEIPDFIKMAIENPVAIRFIEHMPCGKWTADSLGQIVKTGDILDIIRKSENIMPEKKKLGVGPAHYYRIKGAKGFIGFIAPVSAPFCKECNRLRLTADGYLKSCLLSNKIVDLKPLIRGNEFSSNAIRDAFKKAASLKPRVHCFEELTNMSRIGG